QSQSPPRSIPTLEPGGFLRWCAMVASAKTVLESKLEQVRREIAERYDADQFDASDLQLKAAKIELELVRIALSEVRQIGESTSINGRSVTRQQLLERERELRSYIAANDRASGSRIRQIVPCV